jgi:hypothetical protein
MNDLAGDPECNLFKRRLRRESHQTDETISAQAADAMRSPRLWLLQWTRACHGILSSARIPSAPLVTGIPKTPMHNPGNYRSL